VGGQQREGAIRVEAQQALQRAAHCGPGGDQHQPVVGQQQHLHRREHRREGGEVARLVALALQVACGERADHRAQQLHQHRHPATGHARGQAGQRHRRCVFRRGPLQGQRRHGAGQRQRREHAECAPGGSVARGAPQRQRGGHPHQRGGRQCTGDQQGRKPVHVGDSEITDEMLLVGVSSVNYIDMNFSIHKEERCASSS